MKVMIRDTAKGLEAYIPKKDLEEMIVETERTPLWGGWARLANGWVLEMPALAADTALPVTVDARKRPNAED